MRKEDFLTELEAIAPKELALPFDNVGLLVGTTRGEINRVLVALDCTDAVAREAVEFGADMVLTHHPLFFTPIKRILPDDPSTKAAFTLIRNDIGLYAMHTNLDAADGGVNDVLCERLGIVDQKAIGDERIARLGRLSRPQSFGEFACGVEEKLGTRVKVCGDTNREIVRVAVLGGSGGGDVRLAARYEIELILFFIKRFHGLDVSIIHGDFVLFLGHDLHRIAQAPYAALRRRRDRIVIKHVLRMGICA